MKFTHLIVGLGNPEGKYFQTYHNIGFMAAEQAATTLGTEFKKKGNQLIAATDNVLILKPLTYMNLSGQAVLAAIRKHKIAAENIAVLLDDLHIDKGNIRISFGGSGGGHNGLKSITGLLGTNQYTRIRIGIAPKGTPYSMARYVLSKITSDERETINNAIADATQAAIEFTQGVALETLQGKYNTRNSSQESHDD